MLLAIWSYRHFISAAIMGELRARYARSRLGLLWSVLHPLAQALIFALVLSKVLGAKLSGVEHDAAYPIYLLSGIAAWNLFSEILGRCLNVFVEYSSALKKIAFPRICLPMIVWGGALINHVLLLVAIAVIFLFLGFTPSITWLALPLGVLFISLFAFGLGVILGLFNVFSRDIGQALTVVLQLWFWMTPVVYPIAIVPDNLLPILELNPMVALVGIYHDALLYKTWPDIGSLIWPALIAVTLFGAAFVLFRRVSPELVDAL